MVAVIIGSTGLVGSSLLERLLEDGSIRQVVSVSRRPLQKHHPKLKEVIISDFSKLKDQASQLSGDLYFCCLGTTIKAAGSREEFRKIDQEAVIAFAEIAEKNNGHSFSVISAMGASEKSMIFYNQVKGEMEEALRKRKLKYLQIFRPALLIGGERSQNRVGEKAAISLVHVLDSVLPEKVKKKIATDIHCLSEKMLKMAKQPQQPVQVVEASEI